MENLYSNISCRFNCRIAFRRSLGFFICVLMICLASCKQHIPDNCKPYFQYDEIEHYQIMIDEDKVMDMQEKKHPTKDEKELSDIIIQNSPASIKDSSFLKHLKRLSFKEYKINPKYHDGISAIFCERKHPGAVYAACIAMYRDILVFRREHKICGIAKICFNCGESYILGTKCNTAEFGQSGDYDALYKILDSNMKQQIK